MIFIVYRSDSLSFFLTPYLFLSPKFHLSRFICLSISIRLYYLLYDSLDPPFISSSLVSLFRNIFNLRSVYFIRFAISYDFLPFPCLFHCIYFSVIVILRLLSSNNSCNMLHSSELPFCFAMHFHNI